MTYAPATPTPAISRRLTAIGITSIYGSQHNRRRKQRPLFIISNYARIQRNTRAAATTSPSTLPSRSMARAQREFPRPFTFTRARQRQPRYISTSTMQSAAARHKVAPFALLTAILSISSSSRHDAMPIRTYRRSSAASLARR